MIASEKNSMFVGSMILNFTRPQENAEALARKTLAGIDPNLTVFYFSSMDSLMADNFNQDRLIARLTSLFGVLALILASVGLYGVVSFFVARRTSEIGIRMALGAQAGDIAWRVTADVFSMVLVGTAVGLGLGMASARYIETLLYQVKPTDASMLALPSLTILAAALVAALPAVIRAVRIDPANMLRTE
jgi:ABC-type antimicrobial peptide transport system permease subunit